VGKCRENGRLSAGCVKPRKDTACFTKQGEKTKKGNDTKRGATSRRGKKKTMLNRGGGSFREEARGKVGVKGGDRREQEGNRGDSKGKG